MLDIAAFGYIEANIRAACQGRAAALGEASPIWVVGIPPAFDDNIDVYPWLTRARSAALFTGFAFERAARTRSLVLLTRTFMDHGVPVYLAREEDVFPNGARELTLDHAMDAVAHHLLVELARTTRSA